MKNRIFVLALILLSSVLIKAQQENVPLDHQVYQFLHEMSVKNILGTIHADNPLMSRGEVRKDLELVSEKSQLLSITEKRNLKKYCEEFFDQKADSSNTYQLLGSGLGYSGSGSDLFSDKTKYAYAFRKEGVNLYFDILGRFVYGQSIKPVLTNSQLFDIGFRFHGTVLDKLGYGFSFQKGGIKGDKDFSAILDPRLNYNFKFVENQENIGNYDFTEGYLRFYTQPLNDMGLSFELGREKMTFGYGYESKLVLSGDHPVLDFFKFDFRYGVFNFSSWVASTVGRFDTSRAKDYTKYISTNSVKLSFPQLLDFGIGESVLYSGRGIDLSYLNPMGFYKFIEMSIQDRDNATAWIDLQTHFIKNLELQGTFFMDDDPFGNLQDFSNYINKTGYQIGAFWYSPLQIDDLSLILEYTRIRPYVYSHINPMDNYTAWGQILGANIGPNSDELFTQAVYNFNERLRLNFNYQHIRHGDNIYDSKGNLLFNAGGNVFVAHRDGIDPMDIKFLDGIRTNTDVYTLGAKYEFVRQFFLNFEYKFMQSSNLSDGSFKETSYWHLDFEFGFKA